MRKKVEEWLALDDAIVIKVLGNKAIKVIREGKEPLITNVLDFILCAEYSLSSRKIGCIKIEDGTILGNMDIIEVDIE